MTKHLPVCSPFIYLRSILMRSLLVLPLAFALSFPALAYGPGSTPWLGVSVETLSFDELAQRNLDHGLRVTAVDQDSPAANAGLQPGDLLLELNGRPLYSVGRLQWLVHSHQAGDELSLRYLRDEQQVSTDVVLGSWQARAKRHYGSHHGGSSLGVVLQPLTDGLRDYFGVEGGAGMLVAEVVDDSPAAAAGLREGDVIIRMDRKVIGNMRDVRRVLNYFDADEEIEIALVRDRAPLTLNVKLGASCGGPSVPSFHHGQGARVFTPYGHAHPPLFSPHHPGMPPIPDRS